MNPNNTQRATKVQLFDFDRQTGTSIAIVYVGSALARSAGLRGPGWFYSRSRSGCLRGDPPNGPFTTAYTAYRAALVAGECS